MSHLHTYVQQNVQKEKNQIFPVKREHYWKHKRTATQLITTNRQQSSHVER